MRNLMLILYSGIRELGIGWMGYLIWPAHFYIALCPNYAFDSQQGALGHESPTLDLSTESDLFLSNPST